MVTGSDGFSLNVAHLCRETIRKYEVIQVIISLQGKTLHLDNARTFNKNKPRNIGTMEPIFGTLNTSTSIEFKLYSFH